MFGSGEHMTKKKAAGSGDPDTPLFPAIVSMRPNPIGDSVLISSTKAN